MLQTLYKTSQSHRHSHIVSDGVVTMDMDIAHRDYLLATLHAFLGVATLLLCVLAELFIFAFRCRAALYLVPVAALLLFNRFRRRAAAATEDIGLVDFSCLKPPRRLRLPVAGLLEHLRLIGCFDDGSVEFMTKVIEAGGM